MLVYQRVWQWLINPPVRITFQKKSNGRNPLSNSAGDCTLSRRGGLCQRLAAGLQHWAENGSSTSRTREPNNVLFFFRGNPCFKIITCVLFRFPLWDKRWGENNKCSCECGSALDAGEDAGKLFILQSGTGAVCCRNGRYCSSQCRERCNALAALPWRQTSLPQTILI